jgi:hypothetical protein
MVDGTVQKEQATTVVTTRIDNDVGFIRVRIITLSG